MHTNKAILKEWVAEHWDSRRELLVDEADIFPMALGHLRCVFIFPMALGHLRCVFNLCLRELYILELYISKGQANAYY